MYKLQFLKAIAQKSQLLIFERFLINKTKKPSETPTPYRTWRTWRLGGSIKENIWQFMRKINNPPQTDADKITVSHNFSVYCKNFNRGAIMRKSGISSCSNK
jgi:hypothetical protein